MNNTADLFDALHPTTKARMLTDRMNAIADAVEGEDWLAVLRCADSFAALFPSLLSDAAQGAYDAGATKRAIADALGVSPSTFRGMVKS